MQKRLLGTTPVNPLGFGAMNLVHGYSHFPGERDAAALLHAALDAGVDHLDTATLYGGGRSEELIGTHLAHRRGEYFLASKGGLSIGEGRAMIDGRPATLTGQIDASLKALQTEHIDLYYLHRLDPAVPIEESVGALADAVTAGKIGGIGLSEVSVATLQRAHAVHPIMAVQNEYSLATRNPELGMLDACARLGTAFVSFSPLYRALLTGALRTIEDLPAGDMRHHMPRFRAENLRANLALVDAFGTLATSLETTPAALALAWVLAQGEHVHVIPGTTSAPHLTENMGAADLVLDAAALAAADALINQDTIAGRRYSSHQFRSIDSEDFDVVIH
ncbi:aldo/keto reductase [Paeniglutamicibacter cryotolerans]|uniref:Aryl-alcohol dehydrogenase-like predicted oxidoreductase n=1 Tax=Paeniglutamicibacter cryotolerans TaxID=670079 RepID=A0A839QQJ9_9MICC|nr:aldo/keto reductase [Paeniglutamicibacter cryotolerans]MBB2995532.1 aryl-alcohol dehydrogenase-like predicted oxidoreductase [Paeniglutamicibacter cryotolerans]